MLYSSDADSVRTVLGSYSALIPDDATLMNEGALSLSWREVTAVYPDAASEADPDRLMAVNTAHAYYHAANALETMPAVVSTKLRDQSTTFESGAVERLIGKYRAKARSLLNLAYPAISAGTTGHGFFRLAHGKRGR